MKICEDLISEEDKKSVEAVTGATKSSDTAVTGGLAAISATSSADPGALSVMALMKML